MTPTISLARRIMAVLSPLLGARAIGTATVTATDASVVLPRGAIGCPIVTSTTGSQQIDRTKLVVTTEAKTVTSSGVSVAVAAMMGGERYNELPADTPIVWDPTIEGLTAQATLNAPGLAGGTNATKEGAAKRILFYEAIGSQEAVRAFFNATDFAVHPSIVVAWAGSPSTKKTGTRRWQRTDRWEIYVVTSRLDGAHERAGEGLAILDLVEAYLCDRQNADGVCFSAPPARVMSRSRISSTASSFVYGLVLETSMGFRGIDPRLHTQAPSDVAADPPWSDWLAIRLDATAVPDEGDEITVVDDAEYDLEDS